MKKNWKYSLLLIVAVFALTMGIFFLFYRFDNKYTARGDQAIQGILYVPDDDSVHYLAREWELLSECIADTAGNKGTEGGLLQPLCFHWRVRWNGPGRQK